MTENTTISQVRDNLTLFTWKVGGEAGQGIFSAGEIFARAIKKAGYYVFTYAEYPSLIRGGHNNYTVRVAEEPIYSQVQGTSILLALDKRTLDKHVSDVISCGVILYDSTKMGNLNVDDYSRTDVQFIEVPMLQLALDAGGTKIVQNTVGIGASLAVLGLDLHLLSDVITEMFKKKPHVIDMNIKAAKAGYDFLKAHLHTRELCGEPPQWQMLSEKPAKELMLIDGSQAIGMGLIKAGLKAYFAYPMTPATSIFQYLVNHQYEYDYVAYQVEDEIAAINFTIGANYAGARAATGTSGGGFSLMTEALGLAATSETPLVVIDAMRGSPSTGLPTWTEQGDLLFAINAGQGDFPKIVVAPTDPEEAFRVSFEAFNLAEEYQLPVIILTDRWLQSTQWSLPKFDTQNMHIKRGKLVTQGNMSEYIMDGLFKRYEFTEDGISLRPVPGIPHFTHRISGNEHDEEGQVSEQQENRIKQMKKRMQKLEKLRENLPQPRVYGVNPEEADLTIISWGSTKGIILDAIKRLEPLGHKISLLQFTYVWPFPREHTKNLLAKAKKTLIVETNYSGQFHKLLKQETLITADHEYLRYDGRPIDPQELAEYVLKLL